MAFETYAQPVIYADESVRGAFLRSVGTKLAGGLLIAAFAGTFSAMFLAPMLLASTWVYMGVVFGAMFVSQSVARGMVNGSAKTAGFVLGTGAMGLAIGPLLYIAVLVAGGSLSLIAQAGGLVGLTVLSMCAYLWSGPKDLSMIGGAMRVLTIPALIAMGVSWVFPSMMGGALGMGINLLFVGMSGAGLLYNFNQVIHVTNTNQDTEAAYEIALGVIVLFWNVLSLLIRLNNRD